MVRNCAGICKLQILLLYVPQLNTKSRDASYILLGFRLWVHKSCRSIYTKQLDYCFRLSKLADSLAHLSFGSGPNPKPLPIVKHLKYPPPMPWCHFVFVKV